MVLLPVLFLLRKYSFIFLVCVWEMKIVKTFYFPFIINGNSCLYKSPISRKEQLRHCFGLYRHVPCPFGDDLFLLRIDTTYRYETREPRKESRILMIYGKTEHMWQNMCCGISTCYFIIIIDSFFVCVFLFKCVWKVT